jgi:chromosome segregation ATPase
MDAESQLEAAAQAGLQLLERNQLLQAELEDLREARARETDELQNRLREGASERVRLDKDKEALLKRLAQATTGLDQLDGEIELVTSRLESEQHATQRLGTQNEQLNKQIEAQAEKLGQKCDEACLDLERMKVQHEQVVQQLMEEKKRGRALQIELREAELAAVRSPPTVVIDDGNGDPSTPLGKCYSSPMSRAAKPASHQSPQWQQQRESDLKKALQDVKALSIDLERTKEDYAGIEGKLFNAEAACARAAEERVEGQEMVESLRAECKSYKQVGSRLQA